MTTTPPNAGEGTDGVLDMVNALIKACEDEELRAISPPKLRAILLLVRAALSVAPQHECTIVHSDPPTAPDFLAVGTVNKWRERCG